ncbi:MAG TPA: dihydrolipoyl dehydrogenase [Candidatus Binatia bacterium]|nr:dihydrolipoyl dehydrogenase [Candidatus Binatia bacterium]
MPLDLVVVGAGPGGYVAAVRAAQLGLATAVVEADRAGGVCGNWGCIPSKAILADAELCAETRRAAELGIARAAPAFDYARVIARSREVADRQAKGVESLFRKHRIAYHHGRARLARGGVVVTAAGAPPQRLDARHVLLATGSVERTLPGIAVDGTVVLTSREALALPVLPASAVVVGGGAVGVELAYAWASFGARVTVVEMAPALLPGMDADLGRELGRAFGRLGIEVLTGCRVERCTRTDAGAEVVVAGPDGPRTLAAAAVLIAVGRAPRTADLGLDEAGVRLERGFVWTDAAMRTSAPGVWAIGDLVGPLLLAHTASAQGIVAVEAMAGVEGASPVDPTRVPVCVYCQPEVAAVGLTEAEARARGLEVTVGRFPFRAAGKAAATGHAEGFVKVILGSRHREIAGVHMIGRGVTELIAEAGLSRTLEATAEDVVATIHAHPTLAEALRQAVLAALGRAIDV